MLGERVCERMGVVIPLSMGCPPGSCKGIAVEADRDGWIDC